ncbi:hypothetical protein [Desulfosporosinus fructosivorans]
MNPYFVWNTIYNGILTYLVYLFYIIGIVSLVKIDRSAYTRYSIGKIIKFNVIYLLWIYMYIFRGNEINIQSLFGSLIMFTFMAGFILQKPKVQKDIFDKFVLLFVISLIPGVIYYGLETLGLSLSKGVIYSNNQLQSVMSTDFTDVGYYKLYLGAVMRVSSNTRFSGIYDEAGLVGTICAILLAARKFEFKKNKINCALLFYGILSFSLAFYLMIVAIMILKAIRRGQWKIILIVASVILGIYVLQSLETNNSLINRLQNRFQISSTEISLVNNRTTSKFDEGYSELLNGDISTKLFGFGRGASSENPYLIGSSSYKLTIYNYGYFGFTFIIITILLLYERLYPWTILKQWDKLVLLLVFLLSIYQRPGILFPYYFIVLFGGCAFLNLGNNKVARKGV